MRGVGDKSEWTAWWGPRTSLCPSVTQDYSIVIVTLSIVNYMIYRSNGRAFERVEVREPGFGIEKRGQPKTHP
jgi:hypothetical protein